MFDAEGSSAGWPVGYIPYRCTPMENSMRNAPRSGGSVFCAPPGGPDSLTDALPSASARLEPAYRWWRRAHWVPSQLGGRDDITYIFSSCVATPTDPDPQNLHPPPEPPLEDDSVPAEARLVLFGFDPTPATAHLRARPAGWRVGGALRIIAGSFVVAPVVGIVPPHAPWVVGALAGGAVLARRRWTEHFTLERLDGTCPKCGRGVAARPGRLRTPHPVPCDVCHHEARLEIEVGALPSA
jgi:hypothetical protein